MRLSVNDGRRPVGWIIGFVAIALLTGCSGAAGSGGSSQSAAAAGGGASAVGATQTPTTSATGAPSTTSSTGAPSTTSTAPKPAASTDASTTTATATNPPPACGSMTAQQAAQTAAAKLPPPFDDPDMSDVTWGPSYATTEGYDPCAALAWIVMPIDGGTASSPYAIALFHMGQYIGRATAKSYGFFPTVTRVDDATVSVTYHWPHENETTAGASGTSIAQFHFDGASGTVKMSGEVPPN